MLFVFAYDVPAADRQELALIWGSKRYPSTRVAASPFALEDLIGQTAAQGSGVVYTASGSPHKGTFSGFYRRDDSLSMGYRATVFQPSGGPGCEQPNAELADLQTTLGVAKLVKEHGEEGAVVHAVFRTAASARRLKDLVKTEVKKNNRSTIVVIKDGLTNLVVLRVGGVSIPTDRLTLYPKQLLELVFSKKRPEPNSGPTCAVRAGSQNGNSVIELLYVVRDRTTSKSKVISWIYDGKVLRRDFQYGAAIETAFASIELDIDAILKSHCLTEWVGLWLGDPETLKPVGSAPPQALVAKVEALRQPVCLNKPRQQAQASYQSMHRAIEMQRSAQARAGYAAAREKQRGPRDAQSVKRRLNPI